jgi:hypothetical protein
MTKTRQRPSGNRNLGLVRKVGAYVLPSLALLTFLGVLYVALGAWRFNHRSRTATAIVSRVEGGSITSTVSGWGQTVSRMESTTTLALRFSTGRETVRARVEARRSEVARLDLEDGTVVVFYDPEDPQHVRLSEYRDVAKGFLLGMIPVAIFLVVGQVARQGLHLR